MNEWMTLLQNDDYLGVKKHLKKGADVNAKNEQGESILAIALRLRCGDELLALLMREGADLFDRDNEGVSIFDAAITYNNLMTVRTILDAGIDVNDTGRQSGFTALMAAVCYNRKEIVELLLEHGADTALRDAKGLDCRDYARKTHRLKMLELLERGGENS